MRLLGAGRGKLLLRVFAAVEVVVLDGVGGFLDLGGQAAEAPGDAERHVGAMEVALDAHAGYAAVDAVGALESVGKADVGGGNADVEGLGLEEGAFQLDAVAHVAYG